MMSSVTIMSFMKERGWRQGTDKGADQGSRTKGRGTGRGWKWQRVQGREVTLRPERENCKGEEAKGGWVTRLS